MHALNQFISVILGIKNTIQGGWGKPSKRMFWKGPLEIHMEDHGRPLHHLLSGWYMKINQLLGSTKAFLETTNEINEHLPPNIQSVHCYSIAGKMRKRHSAKSERQDMS